MDISDDKHPRFIVTFGGKYSSKSPETIDAEDFIAKKGLAAKGKKCHLQELEKVKFTEPAVFSEDEIENDIIPEDDENSEYQENGDSKREDSSEIKNGAQAGEVIDLGIDDVPEDEPNLFDI